MLTKLILGWNELTSQNTVLTSQLEGPLPSHLINCQHLEDFDIGNNQINNNFSHWLDVLPKLRYSIIIWKFDKA
ncbi:hypothetical protein CICLE_v10018113mg [Citrus x clementina]|uniref:Leucine-rich repeat-containing N-terminal plant-type domain-containing protein n=1 Tax=Citrus clementina TaxID=85681 RepID=V4W0Q8_CITCL|nr:hypothetical protein CICLE_v10018113mg [Citrus x clementina]